MTKSLAAGSVAVAIVVAASLAGPALAAPIELNEGRAPSLTTTPRGATDLLIGEFDSDGVPDLLALEAVEPYSAGISSGPGDSFGGFGAPRFDDLQNSLRTTGDLDGDGLDDFVAAKGGTIRVILNQGQGEFAGDAFGASADVDLADVDSDGDLDALALAYISEDEHGRQVALNDGSGNFQAGTTLSAGPGGLGRPVFSDLDDDGEIDVAACRTPADNGGEPRPRGVAVFLGKGDGTFSAAPLSAAQANHRCESLAAGDLDADGFADLLTDGLRPFFGSATGELTAGERINGAGPSADSVAIADMDRDGALDAVVAVDRLEVRVGDGDGSFSDRPRYRSDAAISGIEAVSLDGEGSPDDLIGLGRGDRVPRVWANLSGASQDAPRTTQTTSYLDAQELPSPRSFDSDAAAASIQCSVDFGPYGTCVQALSEPVADGVHVVTARASLAGVQDPTPAQMNVDVDTLAPELDVRLNGPPKSRGFPTGGIFGEVDFEDEPYIDGTYRVRGSGLESERFSFYALADYQLSSRAVDTRTLLEGSARANRGRHELVVRATDPAGNVTRLIQGFRVR